MEHTEQAIELLRSARTLVVHSRLGNGKTIFLNILAYRLSELGYRCFWCSEVSPTLNQDLGALRSIDNVVILFDSYDVALEVIRTINNELESAKFIVAIRTGVQDVRMHEIQERLPLPLGRINLNGLKDSERNDFIFLLDNAGLLERPLRNELSRCDDVREIVTSVFKHTEIHEKLRRELEPIMVDASLKLAMVSIHLLNLAGLRPSAPFLRAISGADTYALASKFREVASELVRFEDDELRAHSPIFSEYLSEHFFDDEDVVESVYAMIIEGVKRKPQRPYNAITSYFMQVSNLKRLVKGAQQSALLTGLFDRLHRDIEVNREPLFWLQYSILMLDLGELSASERFLNTAYDRAAEIPGFKTYQLDTHALRILLILETADTESRSVGRIEQILTQLDKVASMIGEVSHRPFVLRALQELEFFANARVMALETAECNALLLQLDRIASSLHLISTEEQHYTEAQQALTVVENTKAIILKKRVQ